MSDADSISLFLPLYLAAWDKPFDWARSHCGHFALGWVQAATDRPALAAMPPVAGLRPWMHAVAAEGGLRNMVTARLRCQPMQADAAQAGDLMLMPGMVTGGALGVRLNAGVAVLREDGRLGVVSATNALCAWPLIGILLEGQS